MGGASNEEREGDDSRTGKHRNNGQDLIATLKFWTDYEQLSELEPSYVLVTFLLESSYAYLRVKGEVCHNPPMVGQVTFFVYSSQVFECL